MQENGFMNGKCYGTSEYYQHDRQERPFDLSPHVMQLHYTIATVYLHEVCFVPYELV